MTTVGYGDISPTKVNVVEMIFGIFLMIGGVVAFNKEIGSASNATGPIFLFQDFVDTARLQLCWRLSETDMF